MQNLVAQEKRTHKVFLSLSHTHTHTSISAGLASSTTSVRRTHYNCQQMASQPPPAYTAIAAEALPSIVFLLRGSHGCGITSFLNRITTGSLDITKPLPYHLENTPYVLNNNVQRNAPSLEFHEDVYLDEDGSPLRPDVVVLCFDISSRDSMMAVVDINKETIKSYGMDMPTVVLGLKRDLRSINEEDIVIPQEGYRLAQQIECTGYMECSAHTDELIPLVVEDLVKKGLDVKMGILHGRNASGFMAGCTLC